MSVIHSLKTWPSFFQSVKSGAKTFEVRRNDLGFQSGDVLCLKEYDPAKGRPMSLSRDHGYTGDLIAVRVTYVLSGEVFGIKDGYVVMGIRHMDPEEAICDG